MRIFLSFILGILSLSFRLESQPPQSACTSCKERAGLSFIYQSVNVINGESVFAEEDPNECPEAHYEYRDHPFLRKRLISRIDFPDGTYCINEYYDSHKNSVGDQTVVIADPVRDPRIGRVKLQKGPSTHDGRPVIIARYFYEEGCTTVLDALGRKTVYRYSPEGYLTAIEDYEGKGLYRTQRYHWEKSAEENQPWRLASMVWEDGSGCPRMCRAFQYDKNGNMVQDTMYGNLSGTCTAPLSIDKSGRPLKTGVESYSIHWAYDGSTPAKAISVSEDNGKTVCYRYHPDSGMKTAELIGDRTTILKRIFTEYDSLNRPVKITVDDGKSDNINDLHGVTQRHATLFSYGEKEDEVEWVEETALDCATGRMITLSKGHTLYDAQGNLKLAEHFDGKGDLLSLNSFEYDPHGRLTQMLDSFGNGTEKEYDAAGRVIFTRTLKEGAVLKEVHTQHDPAGRPARTEEFDAGLKLHSTQNKYNEAGEIVESIDMFGNKVHYTYDCFGRVVKKTFPTVLDENNKDTTPEGHFEYDIFNHLVVETDANGHQTTVSYTAMGHPCERIYADGTRESFVYNLDGTLKESVDAQGIKTIYERDLFGRETSVTVHDAEDDIRRTLHSKFSTFHLLKTVKDGRLATTYHYDPRGNIVQKEQTFPEGFQKVINEYDPAGRLIRQTEEWGGSIHEMAINELIYDHYGNLVKRLVKDANGLLLKETDEAPKHDPYPIDRHENRIINSRGQWVRQTVAIDPAGIVKITTYDALGRAESIVIEDPNGLPLKHVELRHDPVGNKVKEITWSNGMPYRTDHWSYDPCNRIKTETIALNSPVARTTSYQYNNKGQLETIEKPDGTLLYHSYTPFGQLKEYRASNSSFRYHFTYDAQGNLVQTDDMILNTTNTRNYNSFGRLTAEELGNGLAIKNTLDPINRRTCMQLADGSSVHYSFDPINLRKITRLNHQGREIYHHSYSEFDEKGRIAKMAMIGSAGTQEIHYDGSGRCRSIRAPFWSEEIPGEGTDSRGNITSIHINDPNVAWEAGYSYDHMNQVASEDNGDQHSFTYDSRSNRIQDNNLRYTVDILDQLISVGNEAAYTYDLNGNTISQTVDSKTVFFRYDALDRLVEVKTPGDSLIAYTYDAFQRRLSKTISNWNCRTGAWHPAQRYHYLYDGDNEIGMADDDGTLVELRILGIGTMGIGNSAEIGGSIALELNGKAYAPVHDHRGNVCCLIDSDSGLPAEFYRYSAFGNATVLSPQGAQQLTSSISNPWQFSSKRLDPETGLVYFGQRYYNPSIARWITKDPLGGYDGPNPYLFLHQMPLSSIDLFGMFSWSSLWDSTKSWVFSTASYLQSLKQRVSYTEHMRGEWDRHFHNTFHGGYLQFSGYYGDTIESGRTPFGQEINDHVRVTLINGILNVRDDLHYSLDLFSSTHGDTVIHYIFHPTEGWSKDIANCILAKFGYTSPYARLLAEKWKELIEEMGGTEGGGTIIHYAHSIGATDTMMARKLLTPEEQRMIRVVSIGSPSMIPIDAGFQNVVNYVSRRDGVCLLDPIGYINGWVNQDSNVEFLGSFWGVPLIDHLMSTESYGGVIRELGSQFTETYR